MSKSNKAVKSVLILVIFTLGSKFLGFIRETLIGAKFGSGILTDTYIIALSAISLFSLLISRSINNTMIPILSEVESKEGKEGKIFHTNNLLNMIIIISTIFTIIAWFFSPFIIKIIGSGFQGEQLQLAILLMRIGIPTILFSSIQGIFRGYLQSEMMFTETAVSSLPFNFVYIFFLLFLSKYFGIIGLMVTSVVASFTQILVQIPSIKKTGFKYKLILDFKDNYLRKMIVLIPPILIGVAINDLSQIIDKSMASNLVEGSISALNFATKIEGLIMGVLISPISTVLFPMLSEESGKENYIGLKKIITRAINIMILISVPATIGTIVLSTPIVKLTFERGLFDAVATNMTVGALIFYSIRFPSIAVRNILNSTFYSLQDTRTPMINGFISLILNVILNIIFIKFMQHRGLALATSISSITTTIIFFNLLRKKIGSFGLFNSVIVGIKALIASIIMGTVAYLLYGFISINLGTGRLYELISLLTSVGVGALIYVVLIYLFRIEEVQWGITLIKEKVRKGK